ncbi:hypothetical protein ACEPAH_7778 [Sanghuangporus vaninii]
MHFKPALVLLASVASSVLVDAQTETSSAATPTSTEGLTECILNCVSTAATSAGCSSFADLSCVCTSEAFQSQARSCLESSCTEEELNAAVSIQEANCGAFTTVSSGISSLSSAASSVIDSLTSAQSSFQSSLSSRTESIGSEITGTGTAASSTGTESDVAESNAAAGFNAVFAPGIAFSAVVGVVGLAVGALLV